MPIKKCITFTIPSLEFLNGPLYLLAASLGINWCAICSILRRVFIDEIKQFLRLFLNSHCFIDELKSSFRAILIKGLADHLLGLIELAFVEMVEQEFHGCLFDCLLYPLVHLLDLLLYVFPIVARRRTNI